jgi:hypothetical protein
MAQRSLLPIVKARFPDIESYPGELELIRKIALGEPARFDTTGPYTSPTDNADTGPHKWAREREIRAGLIRWLATDSEADQSLDFSGIQINGARIVGALNLEAAVVKVPISFGYCRLESVSISRARLHEFTLFVCWCQSLVANEAKVDSTLNLRGSRIEGLVTLSSAHVGTLLCSGTYCGGFFTAYRIRVDRNVELNASRINALQPIPFRCARAISLEGALIDGDLDLRGGKFGSSEWEDGQFSIFLRAATVKGSILMGTPGPRFGEDSYPAGLAEYMEANGTIDLSGVTTGLFTLDQIYSSWPQKWRLEEFHYDRVHLVATAFPDDLRHGLSADAALGLGWLERDESGSVQPYQQFSNVLENMGDIRGATQVRKAAEKLLSERNDEWGTRILKSSIGYGYAPGNAIWGLGLLTAVGWLVYWRSYRMGAMVPTDRDANEAFRSSRTLQAHYPKFHALIYSLENTFPLVKFGQGDKWQPDPQRRAWFLRWFRWAQIVLGWFLAALFAVAVSGLVVHGR